MAMIRLQGETEKRLGIYYQLSSDERPLGEGGMGKVFRGICVNERTGATRDVAIKFMFDDLPASAYERARREAEIQLRNDNLVEMLGFIETKEVDGHGNMVRHCHVISELLTGVSLSDVLDGKTKDRKGKDVPFAVKMLQDYKNDPEHFSIVVVINVLSGLMALRDAGYIHRDIDPSNIMLTEDGHIKLIDFGIAKQMNNLTTGDKALTVAGKFMGKPEYAAPELALGDLSHQNQTTDIYAVGILLYQCIVGHTPFEGARHEVLEKQLKAKMPLGKVHSKAIRNIIATACQKKQNLRYQSSSQMRVALESINGVKSSTLPKIKIVIFGVVIATLVLMVVVFGIVKHKHDQEVVQTELMQQKQQHTELKARVDAKLSQVSRYLTLAQSEEEDNAEQNLLSAYTTLREVEKLIAYHADMDNVNAEVRLKKKKILTDLDSAQVLLTNQANELEKIGEVELAKSYKNRVKAIIDFKTKANENK